MQRVFDGHGSLSSKHMSDAFWAKTSDELDVRLRRAVTSLTRNRQALLGNEGEGYLKVLVNLLVGKARE